MRYLRRSGLASRAAVYAILAFLASDIVLHGSAPAQADSQGVLAEVAKQPAGLVLLAILALGLAAYALWRLDQALSRGRAGPSKTSPWKRVGWVATSIVYFGLCAQAVSIILGAGSRGGPSSHPTPFVAAILGWTGGQELVGLLGAAAACGGLALAVWGCLHDHDKLLDTGRMSKAGRRSARVTGIAGEVTRGLLVLLVSVYLFTAAVTDNPRRVKSLDASLLALAHYPYGPGLLATAAFGLLMFAVYSCFEAAYRRA